MKKDVTLNISSPELVSKMIKSLKNNQSGREVLEVSYITPSYLQISLDVLEKRAKNVIKSRLDHCYYNLVNKCLETEKVLVSCSEQIVTFNDGSHFSFPVYNYLYEALNKDILSWSELVLEQILREMFDRKIDDKDLFYYISERLLIKKL